LRNTLFSVLLLAAFSLALASGREAPSAPAHTEAKNDSSTQDPSMPGMKMPTQTQMQTEDQKAFHLPSTHEGSGTAWQPASVQGPEWMWMRGGGELMAHGVIFVDYNQQGAPRGAGKAESVNVGMLMESTGWARAQSYSGKCFLPNR
jgi:hypothetical protein